LAWQKHKPILIQDSLRVKSRERHATFLQDRPR
jgi:hypothetical protein